MLYCCCLFLIAMNNDVQNRWIAIQMWYKIFTSETHHSPNVYSFIWKYERRKKILHLTDLMPGTSWTYMNSNNSCVELTKRCGGPRTYVEITTTSYWKSIFGERNQQIISESSWDSSIERVLVKEFLHQGIACEATRSSSSINRDIIKIMCFSHLEPEIATNYLAFFIQTLLMVGTKKWSTYDWKWLTIQL